MTAQNKEWDALYMAFFHCLDYYADQNPSDSLFAMLSSMSPYTFRGYISADPAAIEDYYDCMNATEAEEDETHRGYQAAVKFLNMYQNEFGFELQQVIQDFTWENFQRFCEEKVQ